MKNVYREPKETKWLEVSIDMADKQDETQMCVWEKVGNCTKMVGFYTGWKAEALYKILSGEQDFLPIIDERGEDDGRDRKAD